MQKNTNSYFAGNMKKNTISNFAGYIINVMSKFLIKEPPKK